MQLGFGFPHQTLDQTKEILLMINRIRKKEPQRLNYLQEKWVDNICDYIMKNNKATERQLEVLKDIYKQVS